MAPCRLTLVTREAANARVGSLRGQVDFVGDFRVLFDVLRRVAHAPYDLASIDSMVSAATNVLFQLFSILCGH
jgi:hypothetical protein